MDRPQRIAIARARLYRILAKHGVASSRTLEQKISDSGPFNQRIDPHILTEARHQLESEGVILTTQVSSQNWYHLAVTLQTVVQPRLTAQLQLHQQLQQVSFNKRLGQVLEIAVFRALKAQPFQFLGSFPDLDDHDDSQLYSKEEPPISLSGKSAPGKKRFDFVLISRDAGFAGIEVKNVREWLYPNRPEIRDLLLKCCSTDAIPVLIARRIPFVTFKLFNTFGGIIHQTYNQRFPLADAALAAQVKHKELLAYHDVRLGNEPDQRLLTFIQTNLPLIVPQMRLRFNEFKDIVCPYGTGEMPYSEFAARIRRRTQGTNEDNDWEDQ